MAQNDPVKTGTDVSIHLLRDAAATTQSPGETTGATGQAGGDREARRGRRLPLGPFDETLNDAERLLDYATITGVEIDDATRNSILKARFESCGGWTETIAANLMAAESKLAARLKPVTAASLKAHAGDARHTVRIYFHVAIWLAAFIVPASIVTFVTSGIAKAITNHIAEADALAVKLTSEVDQSGKPVVGQAQARTDLQSFAAAMRAVDTRARQLNWFIRHVENDPLSSYRNDPQNLRKQLQVNVEQLRDNFNGETLRLIPTYQAVRYFGQSVVDDVSVFYGALNSCVLPVLYALLGTCAYLLRSFQQDMANHTFIPSHSNLACFLTAGIGGAVVGLFNNFVVNQSATIPPLAIAFLVGYAVDVFFSFLEGLIRGFTRRGSGTATAAERAST